MRAVIPLLVILATPACAAAPDGNIVAEAPAKGAPARCGDGGERLALTGLCQDEAAALLLDPGSAMTGAQPGCDWVIRDTAFAGDALLYRALRCGATATNVELQVGNHMSQLVYAGRAGSDGTPTDADGQPMILAQVFAGNPGGRARALWEARDSIGNARAAARCDLRAPYRTEGLPADALIVDVRRTEADLQRDDAVPKCGPFGYNPAGGSIDFWRPHQGYAWYFQMGTDVWDVDPGSFTIARKDATGRWVRATEPS